MQRVTNLEMQTEENIARCKAYDERVQRLHSKEQLAQMDDGKINPSDWAEELQHDSDFQEEFNRVVSDDSLPEADELFTPDVYDDTYLNMELALPRAGGEVEFGQVVKRMRDKDGLPIGTANDNPILDSRVYEVEFPDGHRTALTANIIAENLFAQVDGEGNRHTLFNEIVGHRTNGKELKQQDAFILSKSGVKRRKESTVGWEILTKWKDGSTTWVALKDFKESYPVQLAEYAVSARIAEEPAFAWWVPYTLRKRSRIIAKVKSKYWIRMHMPKQNNLTKRTATHFSGTQSARKCGICGLPSKPGIDLKMRYQLVTRRSSAILFSI